MSNSHNSNKNYTNNYNNNNINSNSSHRNTNQTNYGSNIINKNIHSNNTNATTAVGSVKSMSNQQQQQQVKTSSNYYYEDNNLNTTTNNNNNNTILNNDNDDDFLDISDTELIRASQVVESQLKFTNNVHHTTSNALNIFSQFNVNNNYNYNNDNLMPAPTMTAMGAPTVTIYGNMGHNNKNDDPYSQLDDVKNELKTIKSENMQKDGEVKILRDKLKRLEQEMQRVRTEKIDLVKKLQLQQEEAKKSLQKQIEFKELENQFKSQEIVELTMKYKVLESTVRKNPNSTVILSSTPSVGGGNGVVSHCSNLISSSIVPSAIPQQPQQQLQHQQQQHHQHMQSQSHQLSQSYCIFDEALSVGKNRQQQQQQQQLNSTMLPPLPPLIATNTNHSNSNLIGTKSVGTKRLAHSSSSLSLSDNENENPIMPENKRPTLAQHSSNNLSSSSSLNANMKNVDTKQSIVQITTNQPSSRPPLSPFSGNSIISPTTSKSLGSIQNENKIQFQQQQQQQQQNLVNKSTKPPTPTTTTTTTTTPTATSAQLNSFSSSSLSSSTLSTTTTTNNHPINSRKNSTNLPTSSVLNSLIDLPGLKRNCKLNLKSFNHKKESRGMIGDNGDIGDNLKRIDSTSLKLKPQTNENIYKLIDLFAESTSKLNKFNSTTTTTTTQINFDSTCKTTINSNATNLNITSLNKNLTNLLEFISCKSTQTAWSNLFSKLISSTSSISSTSIISSSSTLIIERVEFVSNDLNLELFKLIKYCLNTSMENGYTSIDQHKHCGSTSLDHLITTPSSLAYLLNNNNNNNNSNQKLGVKQQLTTPATSISIVDLLCLSFDVCFNLFLFRLTFLLTNFNQNELNKRNNKLIKTKQANTNSYKKEFETKLLKLKQEFFSLVTILLKSINFSSRNSLLVAGNGGGVSTNNGASTTTRQTSCLAPSTSASSSSASSPSPSSSLSSSSTSYSTLRILNSILDCYNQFLYLSVLNYQLEPDSVFSWYYFNLTDNMHNIFRKRIKLFKFGHTTSGNDCSSGVGSGSGSNCNESTNVKQELNKLNIKIEKKDVLTESSIQTTTSGVTKMESKDLNESNIEMDELCKIMDKYEKKAGAVALESDTDEDDYNENSEQIEEDEDDEPCLFHLFYEKISKYFGEIVYTLESYEQRQHIDENNTLHSSALSSVTNSTTTNTNSTNSINQQQISIITTIAVDDNESVTKSKDPNFSLETNNNNNKNQQLNLPTSKSQNEFQFEFQQSQTPIDEDKKFKFDFTNVAAGTTNSNTTNKLTNLNPNTTNGKFNSIQSLNDSSASSIQLLQTQFLSNFIYYLHNINLISSLEIRLMPKLMGKMSKSKVESKSNHKNIETTTTTTNAKTCLCYKDMLISFLILIDYQFNEKFISGIDLSIDDSLFSTVSSSSLLFLLNYTKLRSSLSDDETTTTMTTTTFSHKSMSTKQTNDEELFRFKQISKSIDRFSIDSTDLNNNNNNANNIKTNQYKFLLIVRCCYALISLFNSNRTKQLIRTTTTTTNQQQNEMTNESLIQLRVQFEQQKLKFFDSIKEDYRLKNFYCLYSLTELNYDEYLVKVLKSIDGMKQLVNDSKHSIADQDQLSNGDGDDEPNKIIRNSSIFHLYSSLNSLKDLFKSFIHDWFDLD